MLETDLIPAVRVGSKRLLIALHGLGDSMEGYRWLPQMLDLPELNFLLVNAPEPYYGGYSWYDFAGDPSPGVEQSRRLLFALLDDQRQAGFPTATTVLFGFSQGCLMALEVAARHPHRLAAVIGVSGYAHAPEVLCGELSPVAREQRILLTHGTRDPLIPIAPVREQVEQLRRAGLNITWREFAKEHTIAGQEELDVIRAFIQSAFAGGASY